jgi:hypothetical protein
MAIIITFRKKKDIQKGKSSNLAETFLRKMKSVDSHSLHGILQLEEVQIAPFKKKMYPPPPHAFPTTGSLFTLPHN